MRRAFTLIELLVTMAILIVLSVVTTFSLSGGRNSNDVTDTAKQVATLLREAQSNSMADQNGASWGVYFSNATSSGFGSGPFYALFAGTAYSTSTLQGGQYRLPQAVGYANAFLPSGATTSITFAIVSGVASASTSIQLYSIAEPALSSTITVASSGAIAD